VILTWMMGYLQDEDEPALLDFSPGRCAGT